MCLSVQIMDRHEIADVAVRNQPISTPVHVRMLSRPDLRAVINLLRCGQKKEVRWIPTFPTATCDICLETNVGRIFERFTSPLYSLRRLIRLTQHGDGSAAPHDTLRPPQTYVCPYALSGSLVLIPHLLTNVLKWNMLYHFMGQICPYGQIGRGESPSLKKGTARGTHHLPTNKTNQLFAVVL